MSETSPKYRTGDSGDEQPEDWGGTLFAVPGLPSRPLTEAELAAIKIEYASEATTSDVLRLVATVEVLRDKAATWQALAETEERLLTQATHFLEQYLDARWAGVPYTPEGKVR